MIAPKHRVRDRAASRSAIATQVALVAAIGLLSACGSTSSPSVSLPSVTSSPSSGSLKPVIHGLIDRNGVPPAGWVGHVDAFVVNVNWSDLQPQQGAPIAADNAIDQAITQARALEAQGRHLAIKIRFFAGINAPDWAKNLGGPPVSIFDSTSQRGGTIGRFWTAQFGAAYDSVWQQLAAKYDGVPEIGQIEVARCGTVFTETLVRDTSDQQSVQNLLAAGFSVAADKQCLDDEVSQGRAWHSTRIGLELNPYKAINADGSVTDDLQVSLDLMSYCRQQLGAQCVLENNSIRYPPIGGDMGKIYDAMRQLGPPIAFQTAVPSRIGNLDSTLTWAQQEGADSVELPANYSSMPVTSFDQVAAGLSSNAG